MFLCFFVSKVLCANDCSEKIKFDEEMTHPYYYKIYEGQKICIRSKSPNTAIVFAQVDSVSISVGESEKYKGRPSDVRNYNSKSGLFFRDYGLVNLTASKDTILEFYMIQVPYTCRERIWASNVPDTFKIKSGASGSTCAFFAYKGDVDYQIDAKLDSDDKFVVYDDNGKINVDWKRDKLRNALYEITLNSQRSDTYVSIKGDFVIDSVSRTFSGFLEVNRDNISSGSLWFKSFMMVLMFLTLIAGIAGLVYYVIIYKKTHNNEIGYMSIHTVAGPRNLI